MLLMFPAMYYSSLFGELSHMEECGFISEIKQALRICVPFWVRNPLSLQIMLECNMV